MPIFWAILYVYVFAKKYTIVLRPEELTATLPNANAIEGRSTNSITEI